MLSQFVNEPCTVRKRGQKRKKPIPSGPSVVMMEDTGVKGLVEHFATKCSTENSNPKRSRLEHTPNCYTPSIPRLTPLSRNKGPRPSPLQLMQLGSLTEAFEEKDGVSCFMGDAMDYFEAHKGPCPRGSGKSLADLELPGMDEYEKIMKRLNEKNQKWRDKILQKYRKDWPKWRQSLLSGFNLLFSGVGSKKRFLQKFSSEMLELEGPVVLINGYFPKITVKMILNTLSATLKIGGSSDSYKHAEMICEAMNLKDAVVPRLFVHLNNIDGKPLGQRESQQVLSRLAVHPKIHFLASIDHLNAPLLWDRGMLENFSWLRIEIPTYQPYSAETAFEASLVTGDQSTQRAKGINHVLDSLTPNHCEILMILGEQIVDEGKTEGLTFQEYFRLCEDNVLVSTDVEFRQHLDEMMTHDLIHTKKGSKGTEKYIIPYNEEIIMEHILSRG